MVVAAGPAAGGDGARVPSRERGNCCTEYTVVFKEKENSGAGPPFREPLLGKR